MKNYILAIFTLVSFVLFNCKSEKDEVKSETETNDSIGEPSEKLLDYEGTYKGVFPCAEKGCKDVEMEIKLLPNHGYVYSTKRLGIDNEALMTTGVFEFENNETMILLPEIADAPNAFLVEQGKITRLDKNRKKIETADSIKFVLKKE